MNYLINFCNNKCLFKCNKNTFNNITKDALINLLTYDVINQEDFYIFDLDIMIVKCIICLQVVSIIDDMCSYRSFLMCKICCNECINKRIIIEFHTAIFCGRFCLNWTVHDDHVYPNSK